MALTRTVHNGVLRASPTESEESEEEPGTAEQVARMQEWVDEQMES